MAVPNTSFHRRLTWFVASLLLVVGSVGTATAEEGEKAPTLRFVPSAAEQADKKSDLEDMLKKARRL